jgi:hypothetical protein
VKYTIAILGLIMLALGGCASSSPELYTAIGSDDTAVKATTTLLQTTPPPITVAQAKSIYTAAVAANGFLETWSAGIQNGETAAALAPDIQDATQALANVLAQLQAIEPASARYGVVNHAKLATSAPNSGISTGTVLDILQIIIALAPDLEQEINDILQADTVTQSQINSALAALQADEATLAALVNPVASAAK